MLRASIVVMGNVCAVEKDYIDRMSRQLQRRRKEISQLRSEKTSILEQHAHEVNDLKRELSELHNYRSVVSNAEGLADAAILDDSVNHPLLNDEEERAYLIRAIAFIHSRALEMSAKRDSILS